jgi:UDP-glucuronate decarboxylase
MSKWILVTGGAGLIGVNLCKALLASGKRVLCLDNFSTSDRSNLKQFKNNDHFKFIEGDITKLPEIKALEQYDLESIYNCACPASPPQYQRLALETLAANTIGMKHLLDLCQRKSIPMVHTSTSEVYGDPTISVQDETYRGNVNCYGPRACYDEGKRVAETYCFEYTRLYNVDVRIARLFNTYGPFLNPDDGRVVSNFIKQALNNEDITVYGDGSQTRSFCYVDDTVQGLIALMNTRRRRLDPTPIYNIGNPVENTVAELATKIIKLTGSQSKIVFGPLPTDDPKQRCPNINKAKGNLHWQPQTVLESGLNQTIAHFRKILPSQTSTQKTDQSAGDALLQQFANVRIRSKKAQSSEVPANCHGRPSPWDQPKRLRNH